MSNIIAFNAPQRRLGFREQAGRLIGLFAGQRRGGDDVFWLKENAELLNILECSGAKLEEDDIAPLREFYAALPERLSFFPQYYRFLLSICLDLEDMADLGTQGEAVCAWVHDMGLVGAEMSDLQRAEARRLLARRGIATREEGLNDRLRAFIDRSDTFAVPNKKAAYELTHIVFYLSDYGRTDPGLSPDAIQSLHFAGILAYLDQNADLLAEICISLRFAGCTPSAIWEDWVLHCLSDFTTTGTGAPQNDQYHEYFVSNWMALCAGQKLTGPAVGNSPTQFIRQTPDQGPLRSMSACLYHLKETRSAHWPRMQPILEGVVGPEGCQILRAAEESSPEFEAFFNGFARMSIAG